MKKLVFLTAVYLILFGVICMVVQIGVMIYCYTLGLQLEPWENNLMVAAISLVFCLNVRFEI